MKRWRDDFEKEMKIIVGDVWRRFVKIQSPPKWTEDRIEWTQQSVAETVQLLVRFDRNDYPVLKLQTTESCFN